MFVEKAPAAIIFLINLIIFGFACLYSQRERTRVFQVVMTTGMMCWSGGAVLYVALQGHGGLNVELALMLTLILQAITLMLIPANFLAFALSFPEPRPWLQRHKIPLVALYLPPLALLCFTDYSAWTESFYSYTLTKSFFERSVWTVLPLVAVSVSYLGAAGWFFLRRLREAADPNDRDLFRFLLYSFIGAGVYWAAMIATADPGAGRFYPAPAMVVALLGQMGLLWAMRYLRETEPGQISHAVFLPLLALAIVFVIVLTNLIMMSLWREMAFTEFQTAVLTLVSVSIALFLGLFREDLKKRYQDPAFRHAFRVGLAVGIILLVVLVNAALNALLPGTNDEAFHDRFNYFQLGVLLVLSFTFAVGLVRENLQEAFDRLFFRRAARYRHRMREMHSELRDARERLSRAQRMAIVGEVAASVAHEIKNPLGPIKGYTQMMMKTLESIAPSPAKDRLVRGLTIISEEVENINERILRLLEFSRAIQYETKLCRIEEIVQRAADLAMAESLEISKREIAVRIEDGLPRVLGDPFRLHEAFFNIIQNGVQATDGNGKIDVSICSAKSTAGEPGIEVRVVDNGHGMTPEEARQIFKPFFTTKGGGTGLGLGVVKSCIQAHRGEIAVTSNPNQGATVRVWLPAEKRVDTSV